MPEPTYPQPMTLPAPCARCGRSEGYAGIVGGYIFAFCAQSHKQGGCLGKVATLASIAVDHRCESGKVIAKACRRMGIKTV